MLLGRLCHAAEERAKQDLECILYVHYDDPLTLSAGAYIPENLTAQFYQKTIRFTENGQKPSCVRTNKWSETYEGAELAQNRGQIWTQHAQKPL